MTFLYLIPVVLSFVVLAAHFFRYQNMVLVGMCLLLPLLLFIRRSWAARVVQAALLLGALEWLRTMVVLIDVRESAGLPWTRLAIILGSVALFTAASGFVFAIPRLRRRYWRP